MRENVNQAPNEYKKINYLLCHMGYCRTFVQMFFYEVYLFADAKSVRGSRIIFSMACFL